MGNAADELDGSEPAAEALTVLVEAQGGRLYSLGLRFCGSPEEAEDMVQETFLQAYRAWSGFEGNANVGTWLYTIASRVCQRFHRKKAGEPGQIESLEDLLPFAEARMAVVPDEDAGGLSAEIVAEGREEIEAAIATLPIDFRMPLILKELVGFSLKEVGEILGLKSATVKTRLYRARLRIRHALERALPKRDAPPVAYSTQVCLDLLQAKQDTLDRGISFEFPSPVVCERCAEFFATMDLAQGICHEIAKGELPPELRAALLERVGEA